MDFFKRHIILVVILLVFIGGFIWSVSQLATSLQDKSSLDRKIEETRRAIEEAAKFSATKETLLFLNKKYKMLKTICEETEKILITPQARMPLPEELPAAGVEFKKILSNTKRNISREAQNANLLIPSSIGFAEYNDRIPEKEELPDLMRKLRIAEELITLMRRAGVSALTDITFLTPVDKDFPGRGAGCYREFPVKVSLRATQKSLAQFMDKVRVSDYLFVVNRTEITKSDTATEKSIGANLEILDIVF